ncbi:MAG: choice-of-anchor X domain-containing protein [Thermoanaerobaculia bacterium]
MGPTDRNRCRALLAPALRAGFCALLPLLLAACGGGGGSSPTAPSAPTLVLQSATLSVAGQVVNGMTLPPGHNQGNSTRFEARLLDTQGMPHADGTMQIHYDRPSGMGMMGATSGTMMLYDDGTHGDRTPGDGTYCFEDFVGEFGCNAVNSPMGEYHYDFWGQDPGGHQSNHLAVTVRLG